MDFDKIFRLRFGEYEIEIENDPPLRLRSYEIDSNFDFVYHDGDATGYQPSAHAVKVFKAGKLYKSAAVGAVGGATGIHENSAVIAGEDLLICCADKIFSLALPGLKLNWMKKVDDATCFRIFKNDEGLFVHGELFASRIDKNGEILWSVGFADILVTLDGRDEFIMHEDFIEIEDFQHNKYRLNFDGEFI